MRCVAGLAGLSFNVLDGSDLSRAHVQATYMYMHLILRLCFICRKNEGESTMNPGGYSHRITAKLTSDRIFDLVETNQQVKKHISCTTKKDQDASRKKKTCVSIVWELVRL